MKAGVAGYQQNRFTNKQTKGNYMKIIYFEATFLIFFVEKLITFDLTMLIMI